MYPESVKLDYVNKRFLWQCPPYLPPLNLQELLKRANQIKPESNNEAKDEFHDDQLIYKSIQSRPSSRHNKKRSVALTNKNPQKRTQGNRRNRYNQDNRKNRYNQNNRRNQYNQDNRRNRYNRNNRRNRYNQDNQNNQRFHSFRITPRNITDETDD